MAAVRSFLLMLAVVVAFAAAGKGDKKTKREATAEFPFGKISFEQENEFAPVEVEVKFDGAFEGVSELKGYHVHEFPIMSETWGKKTISNTNCGPMSTGGHYNPYNVQYNGGSSPCDPSNPYATCETGDLSAKNPIVFDDKNNIKQTYTDTSISLFGSMSILGRSIVLHTNIRWYCSDIVFKGDTTVYTAMSTTADPNIKYNALDTVTKIADYDNQDSAVYVTMAATNSVEGSIGYHVHENPITTDCGPASTGGHYDPYMAAKLPNGEKNQNYKNTCTTSTPGGCEVGDLSGKFGPLSASGKFFYTDSNLPGANSRSKSSRATIKGRSIVFHNSEGSRIACGNLFQADKGKKDSDD